MNRKFQKNEKPKDLISIFLQNFLLENNIRISPIQDYINYNILRKLEIFIKKSVKNKKSFWVLNEIFYFLGLDSYLKLDISALSPNIIFERLDSILEKNINSKKNLNEDELLYLIKLRNSFHCFKELRSFSLFEIDDYHLGCLSLLLEVGLIRINRAHFSKKKELFSYNDLSSGELSVLSLILGLSSELENNSIICIDEPELNLHPEWQEKIIQLIELVSRFYNGCHFFIATHSPQLISGINNHNTFILDLSKNRVFNIEKYKNRSSDFQLSEIFNFPGNNNEYLIRKLLLILNKQNVDNYYEFDYESKNLLINISDLIKKNKLHDQDKVKILFELVEGFQG